MKTIRINEKCDKIVTKLAKRIGSTKTDFVRIMIENLTDAQITSIWNRNFYKTAATVPEDSLTKEKINEIYGPDSNNDVEPKMTSYGDPICKECGMGYDECDCVDEIEWEDEDEEVDLPEDD